MRYWYEGKTTKELYESAYREFKRMHKLGCSIKAMEMIAESYPEHLQPQIKQIWRSLGSYKPALTRVLESRKWAMAQTTHPNGYGVSGFTVRGSVYRMVTTYLNGKITTETFKLS